MSGCFLFLSRLASGRRQRNQHGSASDSTSCPLERGMARPLQPRGPASQLCSCGTHGGVSGGPTCSLHSVEVMCSPASSDDGSRSCSSCSSAGPCSYYQRASPSYATSYGSSAGYLSTGAPSPTGHLASPGPQEQAQHAAAIQAACEIVLQEHQVRLCCC